MKFLRFWKWPRYRFCWERPTASTAHTIWSTRLPKEQWARSKAWRYIKKQPIGDDFIYHLEVYEKGGSRQVLDRWRGKHMARLPSPGPCSPQ